MKSIRLEATKYIWIALATVLSLLFGTTLFAGRGIGVEHVVITIVLGIAAFLSTGTIWNWGDVKFGNELIEASSATKSKRRAKLDRMLKRLSDEELEALRQHLAYDDQPYGVGEDGELMYMESRNDT